MNVENETLKEVVKVDNDLKELIVDYVGNKIQPENDEVTLEMVISVLASEFKELVLSMAEENWIRGYQQALVDVDEGENLYKQALEAEVHES
tara:strand:+ start:4956 stop:5231 length:276 start_codon:yes stop_codon:yes gene_type:complete